MRQLFKEFLIGSIYLKKVKKNLKDKRRSGRSNTATTDEKLLSRWIHELTEQNCKERVRICKQNLEKFKILKLCDVGTGDECWFYHIGILIKTINSKQGR